ncbi:DUF6171 family protein [Heyndrickxia ginsengihumi]|uniref:Uncharacterized protein n=1 Tax=Heyndrickxia ginsengihumi TaxID=363870 RepID=A0A0A6V7V7_9BACI|nr:DUF6171 family protein [Heyndrickxia ginsengihumi]KHD84140.1 hypothetical protein NG54_17450 [Heyndrickxia ginsengihumi]MCM3024595.1 DUF6171 family protein [Heyndrickxia ginsengihumi]
MKRCKGCLESLVVSKKKIQQLISNYAEDQSVIVSDEIYESRLRLCHECSSLINGTTRQYCGCFVQFKAKFPDKHCALSGI